MFLVVSNNKGGTGKTTIAYHLAVASGSLNKGKTLLVDTDIDQADAIRWSLKLSKGEQLDLELDKVYKTDYNFDVILTKDLKKLPSGYDTIIVDTDPDCEGFLPSLAKATGLLVVFAGHMSVDDAVGVIEPAKNYKIKKIGIVNKGKGYYVGSRIFFEAKKIGLELYPIIIANRVAFERAYVNRVPIWLIAISTEFRDICEDLLTYIFR